MSIPVINLIGYSGSGKTTLMVGLIQWFKRKGYQVATVKHHSKSGLVVDTPGKDSWKYVQAGSARIVIASPEKIIEYRNLKRELILYEVISGISDVDLILVEGYKHAGTSSILVIGDNFSMDTIECREYCFAIASDLPISTDTLKGLPIFSRNDINGMASMIEERFLTQEKSNSKR